MYLGGGGAKVGLAYLLSAICDRRGRAIGLVFVVILASFIINFVSQLWEPARSISFLGLLHYYRPLEILQSDSWPLGNMLILTLLGVTLWWAGGILFSRRDICTV